MKKVPPKYQPKPRVQPEPTMMKKLFADYLLLWPDTEDESKELLQDSKGRSVALGNVEAYRTGVIVKTGPGLWNVHNADFDGRPIERVPMDCEVGDRVVYPQRLDSVFTFQGDFYVLLRDVNIVCTIKKGPPQARKGD